MTPRSILNALARDINALEGRKPGDPYGPRIRNRAESRDHGFTYNAVATLSYESSGIDLIELVGSKDYAAGSEYFLEPYSTWLVSIYRR